jgi:multiple sugar transport system permease protein
LLIVSVNTLNIFALIQTMTGGGPFFASEVIEVYFYRTAFGSAQSATLPRIGYASAAAVFFGVSVMFFALFQVLAGRRLNRTRSEFETQM